MADAEDLTIRRVGDVAVIQAPLYVNSDGGQQVSSAVATLREEGVTRVVLNLSDCSIANSIGLSFLIEVLETLKEAGGRLSFCSATKSIAKTLQIMGLLQESIMHDGEEEAVAALDG
jgi:anti-anti-sigma factor